VTYPRHWLALVAVVALFLCPPAPAADTPAPESRRDPLAEAVEQLGSSDPGVREEATRLLWSAGTRAEPDLRRASDANANNPDTEPEVAARARALLEKIESGVRPDTPPKALELAVRYKANPNRDIRLGAARGLIELGDPAAPMLLRLWAREIDPQVKAGVLEAMRTSYARYARLLLIDGDDATAEQLLEAAADAQGGPAAVDFSAYLAARGKVKQKLAAWTVAPRTAPAPAAHRSLGWLYLADGDFAAATALAASISDDTFRQAALCAAGDWKALAASLEAGDRGADPLNTLSVRATLYHLAGDAPRLAETLGQIRRRADEKPEHAFIWAKAMFAVGKSEDAIDLLKRHDPAGAFSFLCYQLRFDEAFALAERAAAAGGAGAAWVHVEVARQYAALGESEKSQAALTAAVAAAAARGPQALAQVQAAAVEIEAASGLRDKAVERALAAPDETARAALVGKLFPSRAGGGRFWWRALRALPELKDQPPRTVFDRLSALLGRKLPPEQARAWCAATADSVLDEKDPYARREGVAAVSDLLRSYGLDQAALELLERAARSAGNAPDAMLRLGDLCARADRFDAAAAYYDRARTLASPAQPDAALATYLQGWALKKAGREDESRPLIELGRSLPLGSEMARHAFCEGLEQRGLRAEAAAEGLVLIRLQGLWSLAAADAARRGAAEAAVRRDFAAAANLLDRSLLGVVRQESGFSRPEGYLAVPRAVETYRALATLPAQKPNNVTRDAGNVRSNIAPNANAPGAAPSENERAEAAARTLQRLAALLPADTDWAIRCVAEFDKLGRRDLGDGLYRENARLLESVCERHPAAAQYHNSLAWLAARCGRDLDAALSHARRAVELQPASTAYLDTLAETHFRRGDKSAAVECMKKCLGQEPDSAYFRGQLQRFESGGTESGADERDR